MNAAVNSATPNAFLKQVLSDSMNIPSERQTPEYRAMLRTTSELEEELSAKLPDEVKAELRNFSEAMDHLTTVTADMYYRHGFVDGMERSTNKQSRDAQGETHPLIQEKPHVKENRLTFAENLSILDKILGILHFMTEDSSYTVHHAYKALVGVAVELKNRLDDIPIVERDVE